MKEYHQRQEAVNRYFKGEKVTTIVNSLGKSRKWLHHWIKRYKSHSNNANWYKDESKAPKRVSVKIAPQTAEQILLIRNELMKEKSTLR